MRSSARSLGNLVLIGVASLSLAACSEEATLPKNADTGPDPVLSAPKSSILPTVNIAPAIGWPAGSKPIAASGLSVTAYASGLNHPRWLYVLPNGDVLVAETNAPTRPADNPGLKNWAMGLVKKRAGAGTASANQITLLRGLRPDGSADGKTILPPRRSEWVAGSEFGLILMAGHRPT